ncbi:MAG: hypothetical protein AB8B50_15720 [Pirellulaceae bacterium]
MPIRDSDLVENCVTTDTPDAEGESVALQTFAGQSILIVSV